MPLSAAREGRWSAVPLIDPTSVRSPPPSLAGLTLLSHAAVAALTPFFPLPIRASSVVPPAARSLGYFSPGRGMYRHIHPREISSTET